MVPENILKEHIEKAIQEIDTNGIQKAAHSSTYDLLYNGKRYPPKLVISLANKYANGSILPRDTFSGGPSHPGFKLLDKLGFTVVQKEDTEIDLKDEFSKWLLKHAPVSYNQYLGSDSRSVIERLNEINAFFPERDLFKTNSKSYMVLINYILLKTNSKERIKNPDFVTYDKFHSNGIPKAVIGKNNYVKFLKEKFNSLTEIDVSYWVFQGNPNIYNITSALRGAHLESWKVAAHKDKIKLGDQVIIWQTGDQAGCYALAEVISEVDVFEEEAFELQHYVSPTDKENVSLKERVKLKITSNLAGNPILWSAIKNKPEFVNFKAGNQGTNFSATSLEYNTLLNMAESTSFSWVKTYKQIVNFIKDKKEDQQGLIQILKDAGCDLFNDQEPKDNIIPLEVIDPFTFFCYLNKYYKQRLEILQKLARNLNFTMPLGDFGLPSTNPQKVWVFPYKYLRKNNEIDRLWYFFESVLNDDITEEQFQDILQIRGVANTKLTEILFYTNPEKYFPINGPTKPFLEQKFGINPKFSTYEEYLELLAQIKSQTNTSFYQLSHEAWLWSNNPNNQKTNFSEAINNFTQEELQIYFNFLDQIIEELNIEQEDDRVVYTCGKNYLNLNIGQRFVWRLQPKKNQKFWIMTKDKLAENYLPFDGPVKHYYTLFNQKGDVRKNKKSCFEALHIELQRSTLSSYRKHNNLDFERAVFDKEFRSQFIKSKKMQSKNKALNQLFYGPPGTGKTFGTIAEAIKIVDNDFFKENKDNRLALTKRYQELLITDWKEANGQIAFCTFHQSFTYEDFVEGIKPKTTQNKDIYYDIEPGIFKRICDLADSSKSTTKVKTEGVINWSEDAFRKAFFYKLSLGEANNPDDKEIYEFCRDNGYVSIGFAGAHDLSGKSESQIKELCETINEKTSAGSQLSTFIHGVSVSDYVLISKGNYFVRALGKVVGDYEYHDDFPIAYNHFRKVEWVFTDENIPIEEMYHTTLMQRSIYRIDHEKLKQDFFVQDNTQMVFSEEKIKPYVLVIDEINRGNVASIFGELITLIEPDKRAGADEELQVMLPYSKEKFSVPDNVYIIGTMNTADRSIEALDSALRRRFSFTEVKPNPSVIDEVLKEKAVWSSIGLSEVLETINKRITVLIDRDHQIGHSYFLKLKTVDDVDFSQALKAVFTENIIPLLQEYFFNDYVKIGMILGSGFIKVSAAKENLFAEIEDSLEDDYSDAKEYEFTNLESLDDSQFKNILNKLLNK
jgi:5-methylcytosine-specific restriction protein B